MSRWTKQAAVSLLFMLAFTTGCLAAETKPIELTFFSWWGSAQHAVIQKAANAWAEQHPGVTVSVRYYPGARSNSYEAIVAATVAGVPMDLVLLQAPFIQYAKPGFLQPLDKYLPSGKYATPQNYPPAIIDAFKWQGKVWGIPSIEAGIGMMLFYNKDMFAEAGWSENKPPRTLSELLAAHKKLSRFDPNKNQLTQLGLNPTDAMGSTYADTVFSTMFNAKWYDPVKDELMLTAFEEAAEWIKQIYDVTTRSQVAAMKLPTWSGGLASRKLAMQINGSWTSGELIKQHKTTANFGVSWVPSSLGDKATATLPWGLGIPITSQHPELAYSLMDYLGSPEAQQVMFEGLGWLNVNLKALPRVDVSSDPLVKEAVNMFIEADRVGAPPPLITLMDVRNQIRGTLYSIWDGKVSSRAALEDLNKRMNQSLAEAKSR